MIPKFRAWDKKHKEICEVLQIHFDLGFVNCINEWIRNLYFNDVILMQSTGLKDKNGKEIFEGDILKPLGFASWIGVVKYCDEVGAFILDDHNNEFIRSDNVYLSQFVDSFEILGNIYENKGLLED